MNDNLLENKETPIDSWRKKEIFFKLKKFSQPSVREAMNRIIAENRQVPLDYAKSRKTLFASEAKKLFAEFT